MPQALLASPSDGRSTYTWDPWNRLATTNTSGTTTSYTYDQSGQRVTQSVKKGGGATTTTTYWSRYYEKTGATTTLYVYLPTGELLATIEGSGSATSTYIVHTDHLNSSSVMTDKNGALAQQSAYYPFGAKRVSVLPASHDLPSAISATMSLIARMVVRASSRRMTISVFFESLFREGKELTDMRIFAYTLMPNHWHLVLYPETGQGEKGI